MKVKELINILQGYNPEDQILIRRGLEKGYYTDHDILIGKLYPDREPRIMAGEIVKMFDSDTNKTDESK